MMFGFLQTIFGTQQQRRVKRYRKTVEAIKHFEKQFEDLSDAQIQGKTQEFQQRIQEGASVDDLLPEAFAVVKEACKRLCGTSVHVSGYDQQWDMVPYDVQLIGGIAMHNGSIAEMMTGEGKTLTAALPLYLNALTGKPVHLVTVNDYLAQRDCQWVGALLRFLGLTTGVLTNSTPTHERKAIYKSDVVYGTASEFGFDYLRDNSMASTKHEQVQRGHYFAIIDEVDSILIDEARTPLIISGPTSQSRQMYEELKEGVYELVKKQRIQSNQIVTQAQKELAPLFPQDEKPSREALKKAAPWIKQLWLVQKSTPQNKVLRKLKENPEIRALLDQCDLNFHSDQHKEEKDELLATLYLIVDERSNEYELTDKGIHLWPECTQGQGTLDDFTMLDISSAFVDIDENGSLSEDEKMQEKLKVQDADTRRKERAHNLRQLLRAHLLMEKDVDYIVEEGKVVIIDENTGRPQPGRRFSDGLHQSIEAKEGLKIQEETQTYATITLQNYFRLYDKLSGMTGTATTEAHEFKEIYQLEVLEIPTHKTNARTDLNDEIYMTEREKYQAILKDIQDVHNQGRPILIGTESVDISEKLSRILKQNKIPHTVLNAKQNAKEAEIIAQAGKKGSVTIATNMAGRGTDIKLKDNTQQLGGLYVLGTSRHQSRRIDRQLRGRCARQGDPGSSKFYLSFEDPLLRLFASSNLTTVIQKFRPPEGEPISASILNRSIQTAQERIEKRNYTMRKATLEYDDVMNKQRQEIYAFRNEVLHTDSIETLAKELLEDTVTHLLDDAVEAAASPQVSAENFRRHLMEQFPLTFDQEMFAQHSDNLNALEKLAQDALIEALTQKIDFENHKVQEFTRRNPLYMIRKTSQDVIRDILLKTLDYLWIQHLLEMDHLRADVMLRTHGQKDPLIEFKEEAFRLFAQFSKNLKSDVAKILFKFQIVPNIPQETATV